MSHKPAHWEKPPSILFEYDLVSDDSPDSDQIVIENGDPNQIPEPDLDTLHEPSEPVDDIVVQSPDTQEVNNSKAWEALIFREDIDSAKIAVNTSDAAKIMGDKYSTQPQRATRIAHDAMAKLAEAAGITSELVITAEQLQETYFNAAEYLFNNQKRRVDVDVIEDMLDEGLAPILHSTPIPVVQRYVKLTQYRPEASIALLITKLWAADIYGIDMPYAYSAIRELKQDSTRKPQSDKRY